MRASAVVALVICGTLLLMMPAIVGTIHEHHLVALLASSPGRSIVSIPDSMGLAHCFGFWFSGSVTIVLGLIGGFMAYAQEHRSR